MKATITINIPDGEDCEGCPLLNDGADYEYAADCQHPEAPKDKWGNCYLETPKDFHGPALRTNWCLNKYGKKEKA